MKKRHFVCIVLGLLFAATPSVFGQSCSDYPCVIRKVKEAFDKKNYKLALEQLESAQGYPKKNSNEIAELRKNIMSALNNARIAAETAKAETLKEKERADLKAEEARKRTEEAEKAKKQAETSDKQTLIEAKKAEVALAELKAANIQTALGLLKNIQKDILNLDYNAALANCKTAKSFKDLPQIIQDSVGVFLQEIAFFQTESAAFLEAIQTLNLLQDAKELTEKSPNIRQLLLAKVEKIAPNEYNRLQKRYFPKMIDIKGDSFSMGNNAIERTRPMHKVRVSDFKLAETETTYFQYNLFAKAMKKRIDQPVWDITGDYPVVNITWIEVISYLTWLSEKTGTTYRLPTEAEWEFAAKGGTNRSPYKFSGSDFLNEVAWYRLNTNNRTQQIGTKKPNALGLHDMSGNVWEWCSDNYSPVFYTQCDKQGLVVNPINEAKAEAKVLRGGAWDNHNNEYIHQVSFRYFGKMDYKDSFTGFRVAGL